MAKTNIKYEYKVKDTFDEVQKSNSRFKFKNVFKHILNALKALPGDAYVEEPIVEKDVDSFDANLAEIQREDSAILDDVKIDAKTIENARESIRIKNKLTSKEIEEKKQKNVESADYNDSIEH